MSSSCEVESVVGCSSLPYLLLGTGSVLQLDDQSLLAILHLV